MEYLSYVSTMNLDTERVIIAVRNRPVLWYKKDKKYKKQDVRLAAWKEIMYELIPNCDQLTEEERREADKRIQQRWRTARDTYQKDKMYELTDPELAMKRRKYYFYDMLKFLDDKASPKPQVYEVEIEMTEDSSETPYYVPEETKKAPPKKPKRKSKTPIEFETQTFTIEPNINDAELESEDLAFFKSLQPSLKKFTTYQKLMFRSRVINVVMEMENQIQPVDPIGIPPVGCTLPPLTGQAHHSKHVKLEQDDDSE